MLKKDFLYRKIKLIQKDLEGLEDIDVTTFEKFFDDPIAFHAAERYLEKIVTRAIDINRHIIAERGKGTEEVKKYSDTFLCLVDLGIYPAEFGKEIAQSAGLRNMLVHDYDGINPRVVYDSVRDALSQYALYCNYLLTFIDARAE